MSTSNHIEIENMNNHLDNQKMEMVPNLQNIDTNNINKLENVDKSELVKNLKSDDKIFSNFQQQAKYRPKTDDITKVQEFIPENIQPSYDEIKNKDFFEFTDENDKKYDFYKPKYLFRSKTMLRAFYWSIGIGLSIFCHRYYRKQNLKKSIIIGTAAMGVSFILVWANFELNPFMTSFYFSKYIEGMARSDFQRLTYYNYIKYQSENLNLINNEKKNNSGIVFTLSTDPCDEIAKYILVLDNQILMNLKSEKRNRLDSVLKKIEIKEDEDEENFDGKDHFDNNRGFVNKEYEYDFSEFNKNYNEADCKVDIPKFFEHEEINTGGISLVKALMMMDNKIITDKQETLKLLKYQLDVADSYLRGNLDCLDYDPDYKSNETV